MKVRATILVLLLRAAPCTCRTSRTGRRRSCWLRTMVLASWLKRLRPLAALEGTMNTNLYDAVIPGFALHWDLSDLVQATVTGKAGAGRQTC